MENQESPQTDQDVIDWLLDNLIEKSRTRRGVIKKLKELGLIFKAPTKKSNAAAANKNLFNTDEDDKLRELYDEHRLDKNCLKLIMEVFNKKRSKKAVVKRMVQLGLIADESEIMPTRMPKRRGDERSRNSSESSGSDSSDDDSSTRPSIVKRPTTKTFTMNQREAQNLRIELEESLKPEIDWIIESLKEASEDFEEPSEDPDDAIPIVPFTEPQKSAFENEQFKKLLASINLQAPHGSETYWKIPANMMPDELNKRCKLLSGEEYAEESLVMNTNVSDDDDDEDLFSRLRAQRDILMYNRSDDENVRSVSVEKERKKVEKVGKPNTKVVQQLLPNVAPMHREALDWIMSTLKDKAENLSSDAIDEMLLTPSKDAHKSALQDERFKKLLIAINLTPPNGIESLWKIPKFLNSKELTMRADLLEISFDSSDDEDEQMVIKRKKKQQQREPESDGLNINTQELKQRLDELDTSSDDEQNESVKKSRKNVLESSDEEGQAAAMSNENRKSGKRDRSEIGDEDTPDENEMNASNNQTKRIRRIADSSDED